jgi:hypothetical protein
MSKDDFLFTSLDEAMERKKDVFLFTSLDEAMERKIYVVDNFSLEIVGWGDVFSRHGRIVNIYHVLNLISNLLLISHLTQTSKC